MTSTSLRPTTISATTPRSPALDRVGDAQAIGLDMLEVLLDEVRALRTRVDALAGAAVTPPAAGSDDRPAPQIGPELRAEIEFALNLAPVDFGGGAGRAKAYVFASLIAQHNVRRVAEIGVYRGRSLLPIAAVLRATGGGAAVGIDPWSADEALQYDDHAGGTDAARQWTRATDWEAIYQSVVDNIDRLGVAHIVELVRMPSSAAADLIPAGGLDLVHVDGNHDAEAVAQDVERYLPKLRPGGFLALDDTSWSSIRPTARVLEDRLERVFELCDNTLSLYDSGLHDFAVYRVPAH
jgi:predicted O-methyltransferase YrrM